MIVRLLLALLGASCLASEQAQDPLYGRWKVTTVVASSPVSAMSGAAAARLVGQFLVVTPRTVRFAHRTCRATFDATNETASEFVREYRIDPKILNLPEPV